MTSYYHTPLPDDAPVTAQNINIVLAELDRTLLSISYGEASWINRASDPAVPAAGYAHVFFRSGAFSLLFPDGSGQSVPQYAVLQQQEADGVGGGGVVALAWNQRSINTEVVNPGFVTLAGDAFTLPAGSYLIFVYGFAYALQENKLRLYQTAPVAGVEWYGASHYTNGFDIVSLWCQLTLAVETTYILEHYATQSLGGVVQLGFPRSGGFTEIYTQVEIWKL